MNRFRSEPKISTLPLFMALVMAAATSIAGGVMHAVWRNGQVRMERKVAMVNERVKAEQTEIKILEMRCDRLLDRYDIREQASRRQLPLVPVEHGDIEEIMPNAVATPVAYQR